MKTTIKNYLERFGYNFNDHGEILSVRLGFSQYMMIDLSNTGKIKMVDRLKGWNFLTGIIETRLKGAMLYNTIGLMAIALIFIMLTGYVANTIILTLIFTALVGYMLLWSAFYLVKAESFRQQVSIWIKDHPE
jgi:hypothetical protein